MSKPVRKLSTVVFYQPDEEAVISRPGEDPVAVVTIPHGTFNKVSFTKKRAPSLSLLHKQSESEDSGVKSVSNEDVDAGKFRSSSSRWSRRFSRKLSATSTSTLPVWEFPTFDEMFENGGDAKPVLHRSPTSVSDILPRSPTSTSSLGGDSTRLDEESFTSVRTNMEPRQSVTSRQDSVMSQTFPTLVYKSWEGCHNFYTFRTRLGSGMRHKYFMYCRITSMPFVFFNVSVGMFITCLGVLCFVHCQDEFLLSLYVLVNGILSVFLFPTLIMMWNRRVGGCANESKKDDENDKDHPVFFAITLVCRILGTMFGSALLIYRYYWQERGWETKLCEIEFYLMFSVVVMEWIFLILFLLMPIIIYFIVYRVAPYITHNHEDT